MSEQPYPVGTQCVITWVPDLAGLVCGWGETVVVGEARRLDDPGIPAIHGILCQYIPDKDSEGFSAMWPVAWMRPLEDPDAETIEDEQEVVA